MTTERKVLSLRRDTSGMPQITERLHKVLANAGLGSRRSLEERIAAGEVRVNGEVAQIGSSLNNGDRVELDGRRFAAVPCAPEETRVLMYHKPEGLVTSNDDPEGRPTVFEKLPRLKGARWVSVGRLDINTTGLLLLTTDGELANALMHPSGEVEREYVCRVFGEVTDDHLRQLRAGVHLEDGPAAFDDIVEIHRDEKHAWFRVTLSEGRNREVRRLWEAMGFLVSRLKRIRYGTIELPRELRRGHYRAIEPEQVQALRHSVGLGDAPQSLTLEPVIGQRRAPVRGSNEYRPEPRQQRAWTSTSHDEGRELRAFDRPLLDDALGRRKKRGPGGPGVGPGRKRGAPAKGAAKPGQRPGGQRGRGPGPNRGPGAGVERGNRAGGPGIERGNRAGGPGIERGNRAGGAGGPQQRRQRKQRTMTGPMDSNEMLFKTWYPGEGNGNVAQGNRWRDGDDDNRGNVADDRGNRVERGNRGPVEGNRASNDSSNRDPGVRRGPPRGRPAAGRGPKPGDGNRDHAPSTGENANHRGPRPPRREPGNTPAGENANRRGPRPPRREPGNAPSGEGVNRRGPRPPQREPGNAPAAEGESRQRRGPYGRMRNRRGGGEDGGPATPEGTE